MLKAAIRETASRPSLQPIWLKLLKLCHAGLNYGGGQTVETSGEIRALQYCNLHLQPGMFTLFDVGANDGRYFDAARRVIGNRLCAHLFEPQLASFSSLERTFAGDPRARLHRIALGRESGRSILYSHSEGDTCASLHPTQGLDLTETVEIGTVADVCRENAISCIDLLKIDTEGFEMDVLIGAASMIETGAIKAIQFEFGDTYLHSPYHFVDFWEFLSPRYVVYRILRQGLVELRRYSPDLEVYKIANFLCVLR